MKIYYTAPIMGGRNHLKISQSIVNFLKSLGHKVLSEHVANDKITSSGEVDKDPNFVYNRDIEFLNQADLVIAEASSPSSGVGYEISYALNKRNIPVLALSNTKNISFMLRGNTNKKFSLIIYQSTDDLKKILNNFLEGTNNEKN